MKDKKTGPVDDQTPYKLIIRGKEYNVVNCYLDQDKLKFYPENPRVYSALHRDDGQKPSQEDIEEHLKEMDHVRELRDDIRENDGLIEPLYVKKSTLEVVEGNSRLAAYRLLAEDNAVKWALVKCVLLPEEINDSAIASLLGQLHLKGKKDWSPYEQASFLHRRHHKEKISIKALEKEFNLKEKSIRHRIAVIDFMIKHKDNNTARWSHYDEFLKNRKFKQACEDHADFEDTVVEQIKTGNMKAVEVRDKLKVVCSTKSEKPIKHLLSGGSLDEAVKSAKSLGGDHNSLQRLRRHRLWLAESDRKQDIKNAPGKIRDEMFYELRQIKSHVEKLLKLAK
jgi:hypothetical protein